MWFTKRERLKAESCMNRVDARSKVEERGLSIAGSSLSLALPGSWMSLSALYPFRSLLGVVLEKKRGTASSTT